MTQPVWFPPDLSIHLVSVYREGRRFSPPRRDVIHAFLTIVAREARRFNIRVHAWSLMGSHPHVWVSDRDPTRPSQVGRFRQSVNSIYAKWISDYWKRLGIRPEGGHVFSKDVKPAAIKVVDARREAETFAYIYANPVVAGITEDPAELDGATSTPEDILTPRVIPRPDTWFRANTWPEEAVLQLEVPPLAQAAGHDRQSWYEEVSTISELVRQQALYAHAYLSESIPGSGVEQARRETPEKAHRPGWVNHSVAELTGSDKRALAKAYLRQRQFRRAYRRNREQQREAVKVVSFPYGTDRMVQSYGYAMRPQAVARSG